MWKKVSICLVAVLALLFIGSVRKKGFEHTATADLSAAALDTNTSGSYGGEIFQPTAVLLHASATISETVTVIFNSGTGANYDTVMDTEALSSAQDYFFAFPSNLIMRPGDSIQVTCTDNNSVNNVYVTVLATELR